MTEQKTFQNVLGHESLHAEDKEGYEVEGRIDWENVLGDLDKTLSIVDFARIVGGVKHRTGNQVGVLGQFRGRLD